MMDSKRESLLNRLVEWFVEWTERARLNEREGNVSAALNAREVSQRIHRLERGEHGLYG
jgi:hypothetical protein